MQYKIQLSKVQGLEQIKKYCAYQERCHYEVKEKLFTYGLRKAEVDEILADLIENNYLNEERFAILFAGGKFRIKHWGRKKIQYELQQKRVSPFIIKTALLSLDGQKYIETLKKLAKNKWNTLKGIHLVSRTSKTYSFLLQKGYEPALIKEVIHEISIG